MRLDLFLKASRLIKRRVVAAEMCEDGRALVNGREAKPAKEVRPGDVITIVFGTLRVEVEVLDIPASHRKADVAGFYRVISEKRTVTEGNTWRKSPS